MTPKWRNGTPGPRLPKQIRGVIPVRVGQVWSFHASRKTERSKVFKVLGVATGEEPWLGKYVYVAVQRADGTFGDEASARYLLTRFETERHAFKLVRTDP
jgi:hypothetical protein